MARNRKSLLMTALALTLGAFLSVSIAEVKVDSKLAPYQQAQGVSGNIKSVGSDTMNNLMTLWAEKFIQMYPNVSIEIEGKGSNTAPVALQAGAAGFGPMSRAMKDKEIDDFEKKYGYKPVGVRSSIDMLAVYVHKDNPIAKTGLTLQQVDAIFSKTRKGGGAADIKTWGDVGLTGEWASKPISLYGRNSASGTYVYFKEKALFAGDYKDSVKEQPGSSSVVQGVASDKFAIGYSGIGYKTADVAVVPLAKDSKSDFIPGDADKVSAYPLARFLYVYINHKPGTTMEPLRLEFLKLMFSKEGQEVVIKDGYLPVSFAIAKADLAHFGVTLTAPDAKADAGK